jgi:hypothetical protein
MDYRSSNNYRIYYFWNYSKKKKDDFILKEEPVEIGKQQNGNFAAIYNYVQGKLLKILLRFSSKKIYIVTFYILNKEQEQKVGK